MISRRSRAVWWWLYEYSNRASIISIYLTNWHPRFGLRAVEFTDSARVAIPVMNAVPCRNNSAHSIMGNEVVCALLEIWSFLYHVQQREVAGCGCRSKCRITSIITAAWQEYSSDYQTPFYLKKINKKNQDSLGKRKQHETHQTGGPNNAKKEDRNNSEKEKRKEKHQNVTYSSKYVRSKIHQ